MDNEKLFYALHYLKYDIDDLIDNVLNDSDEDPHYSAVTATNLLKCYIQLLKNSGEQLPFNDSEEYFKHNGYTIQEYQLFEVKRKAESKNYIGKQF
ncbi:MAG: hypothetical protein A2Y15_06965 [Clostridiales bacterium GWF2_36_10]|nr:MAG: hypothetical protein A2Y15_06965 [Clostridiales bacterium GWF2_36_10]HAN21373.1 hypothetical protein [Clostridiales bacterium]